MCGFGIFQSPGPLSQSATLLQNTTAPFTIISMSQTPSYYTKQMSAKMSFNSLIKNIEDPRSFINIIPKGIRHLVLDVKEEWLAFSDEDFAKLFELIGVEPPMVIEALRNNFWLEFDRATAAGDEMIIAQIYSGVCNKSYFDRMIEEKPYFLAYILSKPPEYDAVMNGLLSLSTRRIRDMLNIPLKKPNGELQDAKTLEIILKAAAMIDLRARGNYLNRSETKNLTLQKTEVTNTYSGFFDNAGKKDAKELAGDIDEQIKKLDEQLRSQAVLAPATPRFTSASGEEYPSDPGYVEAEIVNEQKE